MDTTSDTALRELFEREANDELDGIERLLHRISDPEAVAELYRHAHTIKGSAAVMGLDDVAALAKLLEAIFDQVRSAGGDLAAGGAEVITAAVADLRYVISCRLNRVDAAATARDAQSALRALREQLEKPAAALSDATTNRSTRQPRVECSEATYARLDGLSELVVAMASAELALIRLVASSIGVDPDHIPEYGQLRQLLGPAIPEQRPHPATRTALVVEDSALVREHHRAILADAGFAVRTARDGTEALRLLRDRPADVVVTDLEMPELDGIALTQAIRSNAQTSAIPVIVVTSHGDEQTRQRTLAAGAQDFLVKTASADALVSSIARTLEQVQ